MRGLRMRIGALLGLVLWGSVQQGASAQEPPVDPQSEPTQLEDVVVEGFRAQETVDRFIDTVGAPPGDRRLARWHRGVCVGVANLSATVAQYMVDRISQTAMDLGLEPGEPGCEANVVVVATVDSDAVATALVEEHKRAFRLGGSGMDLGISALEAFKVSDRPVRWWQVSLPVDSETGQRAVRLPGDENPPVVNVSRASRLRSDIRDDLMKVIIIIDVERLGETNFEQLTDYVTFLALAQVDPRADFTNLPTVLNLFGAPTQVDGLTTWDRAYLQALYQSEANRASLSG